MNKEKCKSCKCVKLDKDFLNKKSRKLKNCIKCREEVKINRIIKEYKQILKDVIQSIKYGTD